MTSPLHLKAPSSNIFSSTDRQIAASTAELLYDEDTDSEFKEVMPVTTYYYEPLVFILPIFFQRSAMLDYKCVALRPPREIARVPKLLDGPEVLEFNVD